MLLFSAEKTEFPFFEFPYFRVLPFVCSTYLCTPDKTQEQHTANQIDQHQYKTPARSKVQERYFTPVKKC